jgi:hypothetical protein
MHWASSFAHTDERRAGNVSFQAALSGPATERGAFCVTLTLPPIRWLLRESGSK